MSVVQPMREGIPGANRMVEMRDSFLRGAAAYAEQRGLKYAQVSEQLHGYHVEKDRGVVWFRAVGPPYFRPDGTFEPTDMMMTWEQFVGIAVALGMELTP